MAEIPGEKVRMKTDMREAKARKPSTRKKPARKETQTAPAAQSIQPDPAFEEATETGEKPNNLTFNFIRGPEFDATTYDLIIASFNKSGLPEDLLRWPPFNDERITAEISERTNKFEATICPASNLGLGLFKSGETPTDSAKNLSLTLTNVLPDFEKNDPVNILDASFFNFELGDRLSAHLEPLITLLRQTPSSIHYVMMLPDHVSDEEMNIVVKVLQSIGVPVENTSKNPTPRNGSIDNGPDENPSQQTLSTSNTRTHFLADHATDEDLLGYHPYAMGIASFVKDTDTALPLTIAIDGAWGKGKSSLMKMLRNELDPNRPKNDAVLPSIGWFKQIWTTLITPVVIIWTLIKSSVALQADIPADTGERRYATVFINAWRHGKGTQLKAKIVSDILTAMTVRFGPDFLLRLQMKRLDRIGLLESATKSLLTNMIVLSLVLIFSAVLLAILWLDLEVTLLPDSWVTPFKTEKEITSALTVLLNVLLFAWKRKPTLKLDDYLRAPDYLKLAGSDAEIEADFRRILAALEERNCHLALFIDDLDRCAPNECAAVVEALNTFFGSEGHKCLFILGMHREMVASSLDVAYKSLVDKINTNDLLKDQRPFGRRFLEKIVQFVVALPEPDEAATQEFLDALTSDNRRGSLEDITALARAREEEDEKVTPARPLARYFNQTVDAAKELAGLQISTVGLAADVIINRMKAQGVDIKLAEQEASRISELKERIDERKNANENEYVEAFKAVKDVIRTNPRQYKRFFNKLRFYRLLNVAEANPMFIDACEAVIALEHPNLYYRIIKHSGSLKTFADQAPGVSSTKDRVFEKLVADFDSHEALKALRKTLVEEYAS